MDHSCFSLYKKNQCLISTKFVTYRNPIRGITLMQLDDFMIFVLMIAGIFKKLIHFKEKK